MKGRSLVGIGSFRHGLGAQLKRMTSAVAVVAMCLSYVASPAVAAASAVKGYICSPEDLD